MAVVGEIARWILQLAAFPGDRHQNMMTPRIHARSRVAACLEESIHAEKV